jgi:hypothetical protein
MRYLLGLLFLVLVVHGGWAYWHLYRLDRALLEDDQVTLAGLVNLEAVRMARDEALDARAAAAMRGEGPLAGMVRQGARWLDETTRRPVDLAWVQEALRWAQAEETTASPAVLRHTTFAFFESPTRFLVRIGELGRAPIHLRLQFVDWRWEVVGIYPSL